MIAITDTRGKTYGDFKYNASTTQRLMRVVKEADNFHAMPDVHQEAIHMILHKISRMVNGDPFHEDNCVDKAGYAN